MPRKGSRCCSKCGYMKNPSGYCPTCYQNKKCSSYQPCASVGYFSDTSYEIKKEKENESARPSLTALYTSTPIKREDKSGVISSETALPSTGGDSGVISSETALPSTGSDSGYITCDLEDTISSEIASPTSVREVFSPIPVKEEFSPTPVREEFSPTPVREVFSPSPVREVFSLTPVKEELSPTPVKEVFSPTPVKEPTLVKEVFSPTPVKEVFSPTPVREVVSPTLVRASPSPVAKTLPSPITLTEREPTDPDGKDATKSQQAKSQRLPLVTSYQIKKEEEAKTTSTTVSLSTKTAQVQCSKCGHTKNPSGYCPTCYQTKKQEQKEFTRSSLTLSASRYQSTPIKLAHKPAGYITPNLEDTFCIISDRETASPSSASDSDYIIWDLDDTISTLVRASPSLVAKTASSITLTERGPTYSGDKDATTPNKSIPTKPVTTSEKPKVTTSNSLKASTQATPTKWIYLAFPSISASTQPIGTAPVTMMPISEKSPEWAYISMRMLQTMPSATIQSISKVHNEWLMERYKLAKRRLLCKYNNKKIKEYILFQGTSEVPPSKIINSEFGFDFRHCSKGPWGIGACFAVNANFSNSYSYKPMGEGYREILAAWVLTGDSYRCEQGKTLRRPPAKSPDSDESYDTVCGHVGGSDVYVVYDHEKAYPSYIIRYTV